MTPFEQWWPHYPKKVGKIAAEKAFARAIKVAPLDLLVRATDRYAVQVRTTDWQFIKHPSTWLNAGCWLDEVQLNVPSLKRMTEDNRDACLIRMLLKGIKTISYGPDLIRRGLAKGLLTEEQAKKL